MVQVEERGVEDGVDNNGVAEDAKEGEAKDGVT